MLNWRAVPLHIKVIIALVLGVAVGMAVFKWWTPEVWASLGVKDSKAYLAHAAFVPGPAAAGEAAKVDPNAEAGRAAAAIRFLADANTFVGQFFLRSLRFIAVPIVLFSLILAVAGVGDLRIIGRIGVKTLLCFGFTLIVAVTIAVLVGKFGAPGDIDPESRQRLMEKYANPDALKTTASTAQRIKDQGIYGFLMGIIPTNPFNAIANAEMLQVVATAFLVGVGLTFVPKEKAAAVTSLCEGMTEAIMMLVGLLMRLAPVAVFCLVVGLVAALGLEALEAVAKFCLCVIGGLAIVLFIEYPLLMMAFTQAGNRMTYRRFFKGMAPAMTLAFSSSSSSATLPVTIKCARDGLKVPSDIVNFVCSMGTTLNMDGSALYQVISALFLAQLYGIDLTLTQHVTVGVMACVVAVGMPGLPGAGVAMLAIVLESVNVPTEGVAIILAVDRVLDMCRTIVNVSGDTVACVVVAGSEGRLGKDQ